MPPAIGHITIRPDVMSICVFITFCNQSLTNVYIQIYIDIYIQISLGSHNFGTFYMLGSWIWYAT